MKTFGKKIDLDYTPILLTQEDLQMITDSLISALCIDDELAANLVRRLVAEYRKPPTIQDLALSLAS